MPLPWPMESYCTEVKHKHQLSLDKALAMSLCMAANGSNCSTFLRTSMLRLGLNCISWITFYYIFAGTGYEICRAGEVSALTLLLHLLLHKTLSRELTHLVKQWIGLKTSCTWQCPMSIHRPLILCNVPAQHRRTRFAHVPEAFVLKYRDDFYAKQNWFQCLLQILNGLLNVQREFHTYSPGFPPSSWELATLCLSTLLHRAGGGPTKMSLEHQNKHSQQDLPWCPNGKLSATCSAQQSYWRQ